MVTRRPLVATGGHRSVGGHWNFATRSERSKSMKNARRTQRACLGVTTPAQEEDQAQKEHIAPEEYPWTRAIWIKPEEARDHLAGIRLWRVLRSNLRPGQG